jgi:hypothetical protein
MFPMTASKSNITLLASKNRNADRPVSNETSTFIERDIFMSTQDSENRNPSIWIEQRTYESGKETTTARELFFLERLVDGKVYIFKECGDQILGEGKLPDLHFTARVVSTPQFFPFPRKSTCSNRHIYLNRFLTIKSAVATSRMV